MRWKRLKAAFVVSIILLGGCGGSDLADQPWMAYHQQLANDLAVGNIEQAEPENIGAFPERKARLIEVPETRDSILNVYALRECQITSLVAARNNQLGRVAPPSQQWLYERKLWQRLSSCWNSDIPEQLSDENKDRLEYLTTTKTAQLPAVSWNAIFDSSEWEHSFSRASQPLTQAGLTDVPQHLEAIDYLQQMTEHQFDPEWQQDSSTLESHLKTLQERPLTAEVLRMLLLANQRLREANNLLRQQNEESSHCLRQWDTASLERLAEAANQWLTAINRLIDTQPVDKPRAVQRYQTRWLSLHNPQAPWAQFQQAKSRHESLRAHFDTC